jgi:hypothetical protein
VAHREAYRLTYGEIPAGLLICHHCDNRACVRPDHLFLGTYKDNAQDMVRKGRDTGAQYIGRTHCIRGHELTPENIYLNKRGKRVCRTCQKAAQRRFYQRAREAVGAN